MKPTRFPRMVTTVLLALLAAPVASQAQTQTSKTPVIIGSLANFDAVNDNPEDMQGFEIQLEGLDPPDISRVFGQTVGTCYIRYCIGSITPYADAVTGKTGVKVRWTANYDAVNHVFTTPLTPPGGGNAVLGGGSRGTPSVVAGAIPPRVVTGESCWTLGLGGSYEFSGCEHFGVSTLRPPTAPPVYHWLKGDPTTGALAYPTVTVAAGVTAPAPVAIAQPVAVVDALGQVQAVIQAVQPVVAPLPHRYGKAEWVKVYKTELPRNADLDELVGGHANNVVPNAHNVVAETAWKLLQYDVTNPNSGSSQLKNGGAPNAGSHSVVRRYEFYKYTGPVQSGISNKKNSPSLDLADGENSACVRDANGECTGPGPNELGDFIGAQMAAQNLDGAVLINQTITGFVLPAALTFTDPPFILTATGGLSGNPVVYTATGACASTLGSAQVAITGAGTCMVTASQDGNAGFSPAPPILLSVEVAKAAASVTFDAGTLSQVYSGIGKTVSTTTAPGGLAVDLAFTGTPLAAGLYPVTATINEPNYTGSATGSLTITQANAILSIAGYTGIYDGAAHGATGTATGVQGESLAALLGLGASFTNAPGGTANWAFAGDTNYHADAGTAPITINKADATIAVIGYAGTYDGAAHGATGTATGVSAVSLNALLSLGASFTNVPGGAATWTFAGDANYNAATGSATIAIGKAAATVLLSNLAQTYTGGVLTPTATTTPAVSFTLTGAPQTAAGSYPVSATVTDPNYDGTASGTFTIGKAAATVLLSNLTQTYTGGVLTPTATTTPAVSFTLTGAPQTAAGSYPVTATVTDPNYNGTASGTFTIGKAAATVLLSNLTQTFTGSPLSPTATTTPAVSVTLTGAPQTAAGSYAVTATVTDPNYQGSASGTFTIIAPPPPPPPPPAAIAIAPIGNRSDKVGAEVELQVMVAGAGPGGRFSAVNLPDGIRIDQEDGEIQGRIVGPVGTRTVTVSFTKNGVTFSRTFTWEITPAAPRKGGKG